MTDQWSYAVVTIHNPQLAALEDRLRALGEDGWELVAATSTSKVVAMVGNELVFILKKPGAGHRPPGSPDSQFESAVPW